MPPKGHRTVTLSSGVYDSILSVRDQIARAGLEALSAGLAPEKGTALTLSEVVAIGIRAIEQDLRRRK
jgi:hypothetical protein